MRGIRKGERGAAAVEFALIAPLFFMLIMGMISGGFAFDRKNSLTHSSREGVRFGATYAIESSTGVPNAWLDQIANVAVRSAAGQLGASIPGRAVCVAYVGFEPRRSSSADWTRKRVETGSTVTYASGSVTNPNSWCFDDGRGTAGTERRVQVQVRRDTPFNLVLWNTTLELSSEAVARYEAVGR